jgi:16S rRNA (guanine966-N2)-methyltransferase
MRIITGIAKGRKIKAPSGMDTRPTLDRVKESIFDILACKIEGKNILDLFAGTGNLGLEAISRGANKCVFVENNRDTYKILQENVTSLGFQKECELYNRDSFTSLKFFHNNNNTFDIIFLDPPYGKGYIEKAISVIDGEDLLNDDGIIVCEYDEKDLIPDTVGKIRSYRTEKYGRVKISLFTQGGDHDKNSSISGEF